MSADNTPRRPDGAKLVGFVDIFTGRFHDATLEQQQAFAAGDDAFRALERPTPSVIPSIDQPEPGKPKLRCSNCGATGLQMPGWLDADTGEAVGDIDEGYNGYYCPTCESHHVNGV